MNIIPRKYFQHIFLITALLMTGAIFYPGLSGPWLVDDSANLSVFNDFSALNAPYKEIIFNNKSGPLGRPVAMASFSINHALGFFSNFSLKATSLMIHLANGLLIYFLLARLLLIRPLSTAFPAKTTAALITLWWLVLPIHISSVLYIVQRMTLLAAFFSLASCLAYTQGRQALIAKQKITGFLFLSASLFLYFPLAVLSKESAFSTVAWLVLIELFFFSSIARQKKLPLILGLLTLLVVGLSVALIYGLHIGEGYVWRDFSLSERLLTQPRVIWDYISAIYFPRSTMGVFHDDFPLSTGWFSPWTTAAAIIALLLTLIAAIKLSATRWWALSLGIFLYLSGHLIESTFIGLEIYFEHRNYLPSLGLLMASSAWLVSTPALGRPIARVALFLYIALLCGSTLQQSFVWKTEKKLLEISALNHEHSLRAWTDYSENLLAQKNPLASLKAAQFAAQNNPQSASIFYLQMIATYCRIDNQPPAWLIQNAGNTLTQNMLDRPSLLISLGIGLENILISHTNGHCQQADFSPLVASFPTLDAALSQYAGNARQNIWFLRLQFIEWLIATHKPSEAAAIARDAWGAGNHADIPMIGLAFARALHQQAQNPLATEGEKLLAAEELKKVVAELISATPDAPADFRAEIAALKNNTVK